jgi:ubiquinone/menaquinone biosynthesis C-methylase UbiE
LITFFEFLLGKILNHQGTRKMSYLNLFSGQADLYAASRPQYPAELFEWIASVAPATELAVDCATGNGQAAIGLAEHFRRVIAIDASAEQIGRAMPHERVEYRVATAEETGLPDGCADLVAVATGVHWFYLDRFYPEVRRVLRPDGIIAVWSYQRSSISPEIDEIIARYSREIVGPYWNPRIALVNNRYRTLPFPFEEIEAPQFEIIEQWSVDQIFGYLASWSSTQSYVAANGHDPLDQIRAELAAHWTERREVRWELFMRVGRVIGSV